MHLGFVNPGFNSHSFATAVQPILGTALFTRILRSEPKLRKQLFLKALYLRPLVGNPSTLSKLVFGECGEPRFEMKLVPANLYHWSIDLESRGKVVLRSPSSSDRNEPRLQALYFVAVKSLEFAESRGLPRLGSIFRDALHTALWREENAIDVAVCGAVLLELTKGNPSAALGGFEDAFKISHQNLSYEDLIKAASKVVFSFKDKYVLNYLWFEVLSEIPLRIMNRGVNNRFAVLARLGGARPEVASEDGQKLFELSSQIVGRLSASADQTDLGPKVLLGMGFSDGPLSIFASDKGARLELPDRFLGLTQRMNLVHALRTVGYDYEALNRFLRVVEHLPADKFSALTSQSGPGFIGINIDSIARAANWHSDQELADALDLSLSIRSIGPILLSSVTQRRLDAVAGFVRYDKIVHVDSRKIGYLVKAASFLKEVAGAEFSGVQQLSGRRGKQFLDFTAAALYFAELVESAGAAIKDSDVIKVLKFGYRNPEPFNSFYRSVWREPQDFLNSEDEALSERLLRAGIVRELAKRVALPFSSSSEEESYANEIRFIRDILGKFGQDAESLAQEFWRAEQIRAQSQHEGPHQLQFDWNEGTESRAIEAAVTRFERHFVQLVFEGVVQGVIDPSGGYTKNYLSRKLKIDGPPYFTSKDLSRPFGPEYQRCFREVIEIGYKALEEYHGQGALMFASRRCHPDRATQMEQFGQSCARSFFGFEGRGSSYPGSGFIFDGLNLINVFPQSNLASGFLGLAQIYPWAKDVVAEVEDSTLVYARGLRIVMPPRGSRAAKIQGHDCALLSFQDHFGDPDLKGVFLVSRTAAAQLLEGFKRGDLDLSQGAEAVLRFLTATSPSDLPPLCLSWISNLGGLCNAWPPKSDGLWAWERKVKGATIDFDGHCHKSYVLGEYQSEPNPAIEREFARFQAAHHEVYRVASNLFATEKLWRVAMSRFSQGHFFGSEQGEDIYTQIGGIYYPSFGAYMLGCAINWNVGLRARGVNDAEQYPVLVIANPLDHWGRPPTDRMLDTHSLALKTPEGVYQFGNTVSLEDRQIWIDRFWWKAESLGFEIRPEHRKRLGV